VLWKMGGVNSSKDNAAYVAVADPFHEEHDARLVRWSPGCNGGSGQISMVDDENNSPIPGRAVIYDVVVGGDGGCPEGGAIDGGSPGQATVAWQYANTLTSVAAGSFRLSPTGSLDGSRVIDWGLTGDLAKPAFVEVDAQGNKLLEFTFTSGLDVSFRAIKVPTAALDLNALRKTAGAVLPDAGFGL